MHAGESLTDAARQRRAGRGGGHQAGRLEPLTSFSTSKSVLEETAHLFAAYDLAPPEATPDSTEFLRCEAFPFADDPARHGLVRRDIDSITIAAALWVDRQRRVG